MSIVRACANSHQKLVLQYLAKSDSSVVQATRLGCVLKLRRGRLTRFDSLFSQGQLILVVFIGKNAGARSESPLVPCAMTHRYEWHTGRKLPVS